ncbi:MAG: TPM domain-containing protein [Bacteroidales bacterium]|nr:TPM domain-containing protein [Bacteroidales bacterium]
MTNCCKKYGVLPGVRSLFVQLLVVAVMVLLQPVGLMAQVPERPQPQRLVNDLADIFSSSQEQRMESALVAFADSTSNQIAVVSVPELYGMDKAQLAFEIGEKWGVGQQKFDNGVVILVKPKVGNSRGEVFIATGYGLEGVLTDAVCRRIIEQYMIPAFQANDYFAGVVNALNVMLPLVAGEISTDEFASGDNTGSWIAATIFLVFILLVFIALLGAGGENGSQNMGGGNHKGPSAADLIMLGILSNASNSRRSSGWGGSSGGFGGGFGGGGFGGFGGGSFGGGGAGGSW